MVLYHKVTQFIILVNSSLKVVDPFLFMDFLLVTVLCTQAYVHCHKSFIVASDILASLSRYKFYHYSMIEKTWSVWEIVDKNNNIFFVIFLGRASSCFGCTGLSSDWSSHRQTERSSGFPFQQVTRIRHHVCSLHSKESAGENKYPRNSWILVQAQHIRYRERPIVFDTDKYVASLLLHMVLITLTKRQT